MPQSEFLKPALEGRPAHVQRLAIKILNVYLVSPLSSRDETADQRKGRLRSLVEEAVRHGAPTGEK